MQKECVRECLSKKLVWTDGEEEVEVVAERDEDDEDSDASGKASTTSDMAMKFDVSGCALWLAGLAPDRAPKKRTKVVNKAFDCPLKAQEEPVTHAFMVDHAWALLET